MEDSVNLKQMLESQLLETFHADWLDRMARKMARGTMVVDDFRDQLNHLYSLLTRALDTGDPTCLDDLLEDWATNQTQSDLDGASSSLTAFIKETMLTTQEVAVETLPPDQALKLIASLNACFAHAFEHAARSEMQIKIRHLNAQLNQVRQSLEKFDQTKSDFIAVAAHELKTPLTLVEGYAAMLREALERPATYQPVNELLNGINNGAQRLKTIIDDMIDVSLIDNNLMAMNFQPFWLNRLFGILHMELEPIISARQQILEITDFAGVDEINYGDPERLLQVLRNVLTNAIKYTPDQGKIKIDGRKLPGFLEVTITDTGIGIAVEDQPLIFEKFSRLGNTALHSSGKTKYKGGGPGLGLHIARGIIVAHGGAIWVESPGYDETLKPGSTFHIILPVRSAPPDDKLARLFVPLDCREPEISTGI